MSQDQIAKLMAIAGRAPATATPVEPTLGQPAATDEPSTSPASVPMPALALPPPLLGAPSPSDQPKPEKPAPMAEEPPARRVARRRPAGPVRGKIAANDDVPSIGGLIYALEQKPSSKVFRLATIGSIVWAIGGLAIGALTLAPQWQEGASIATLLAQPTTFYTATAIIAPIGIIWLLALLSWHVASLALKSSTMSEVAIRLAEPDRTAEQSIASLGQAVRRQVSFMNDAVSRALGRAGELEALVHNQIAELERSYEQNEQRIRDLIKELSGERHALVDTSTSVTDTLRTLGTEIPMLIEKLSTQQVTLSQIISGAGENLANLEGSLATATGRFEGTVGARTQQLQTVLEDYTAAFATALGARTEQMRLTFDGYMQTLDTTLGNRTENLQTVFEEYARALDTTLSNRAQALDIQLVERTRSLDEAFSKRLELFDDQIMRSTTAIDTAVSEKASLLTNALELHAHSFRETISRQAADLDDSVMNGISAVRRTSENITRQTMKAIDGLAKQSGALQNVAENLFSQIHGVTDRFESHGEQILKAANVLDTANLRIESTLQSRHAELSSTLDRFSGKADEFGRTLAGYSTDLEGSLSNIELRARAIADELRDGAESKSRVLMAELDRVKNETEAHSDRAIADLRTRFQSVSGDLSREFEELSSRLASASDETRERAAEAAATLAREQARIREEAARLPASTRETAESMRRALQDQLRAIEQLNQISQRANAPRDVVRPELPSGARSPVSLTSALSQQGSGAGRGKPSGSPDGRESWSLGDLLARASHEDEAQSAHAHAHAQAPSAPPPPTASPARLDIATIARALDPSTASAIWGRIRAGQRNVLVRSIYAPEARALFDQITNRIRVDRDLEQSIFRYLTDFERIIKDAEARDPSGRAAQNHLVSDTGRVYLFLAHAAGRIR
ncbi:Apolipoprotein A1/A4/E [Hyphomicrobium sp. GJ21]|uniref:apolipoprotein A1/A4/E domain-containing protein n=1 Tax=Hyphomicrobium sp. GJ21 TaxID=113574 RepID=UPI000622BCFB|nr:apolipoprotein A1/A4/E domain-containing protein [Hyphomicrobium sp. GJ21]CEJ85111.1 Apolipoprotein A1/A4/E [Hyphomicrobium sp. GJ21]